MAVRLESSGGLASIDVLLMLGLLGLRMPSTTETFCFLGSLTRTYIIEGNGSPW